MAKPFPVSIVTPDRAVYEGEVESLRAPAHEGLLGILAGHAPMLCVLQPGAILLRSGAERKVFAVGGGYLEVAGGKVLILADSAETPEAIDRKRAEASAGRARGRIQKPPKDFDLDRATIALQRAINRLRLAEKYGGGAFDF